MKYCKDCKHCLPDGWIYRWKFSKCQKFPDKPAASGYNFIDPNLVTKEKYHYCATARNLSHMCGNEGILWESKTCL